MLPLLSLIGLYGFATSITAGDAITLARALSIRNTVDDPIGLYTAQVQTERLLATFYLAAPTAQNRAALTAQEAKTDRFLAELRAAAGSASTARNASPQVKAALATELADSATLPALRQSVGSLAITIAQAQSDYAAVIAAGFRTIVQTVLEMPNANLETQALATMRITQGMEILLQEQALLVGDVMTHSFSAAAHTRFAILVGEHRELVAEAMTDLDPVYLSYYRHDVSPSASAALTSLENAVIAAPAAAVSRIPLLAYEFDSGIVAAGLGNAGFRAGLTLATYGNQVAGPVNLRLILAGGGGLIAFLVSVIASVWIGRGLVRELGGLRRAALELADVRLPQVVRRLTSGEDIGAADEVPFPSPSQDEIGQVRQAFNSVQRTAIEAAVGQARMRAGIATVFRNLARRSQTLLHRQLAMLDDLELRAVQPGELDSLFQLDHLTTRMRRHAEGLVVLAGDRPGRGWNKPVPLGDVMRAAVAEVEDYRRVRVITRSRAALAGRAVADVIHLIAELVENATLFSPPNTPVRIIGDLVGRGFAVEIEDRGLGIAEETMAELNAKLADPPQVDLAATEQLGLYVTARLAKEHGIRVTLRDSVFGGTCAVVLIPNDLVVSEESYAADSDAALANQLAIHTTGRHTARRAEWNLPVLGGDAPANGPRPAGVPNGAEPSATTYAPVGIAEPLIPPQADRGEYLFDAGGFLANGEAPHNGDSLLAPGAADSGVQHDPGEPASPPTVDLTELGLPRRIREASLAPELRDTQPPRRVGGDGRDGGVAGSRSPGEQRDAFTALQRGWERGRAEPVTPSDIGGASSHQADPNGNGDGLQPPSPPEQEGTS